ncbi:MAG: hypothetical protein AAGD14_09010 [Planctomycetota bacterium]
MPEHDLDRAIDVVRATEVDPELVRRVGDRIQREALGRRRRWFWLALPAAALLLFALWPREEETAAPQALQEAPAPEPSPVLAELRTKRVANVDFPAGQVTLRGALQYVTAVTGRKVELSAKAEEDKGAAEVVLQVDNVTVESLLQKITEPLALTFRVEGDKIVVYDLREMPFDVLAQLRALAADRIVVRTGQFDEIHRVFARYRIPHTRTAKVEGKHRAHAGIVFFDCTRKPPKNHDHGPLRDFVARGGWVVASDWAVSYIQGIDRDMLKVLDVKRLRGDLVTEVTAADRTSPLLRGVLKPDTRLWFEEACAVVRVKGGRVLLQSKARGPVLVERTFGKGRLYFTLAHFHQKRKGADVGAMDRLILNLLEERFVRN